VILPEDAPGTALPIRTIEPRPRPTLMSAPSPLLGGVSFRLEPNDPSSDRLAAGHVCGVDCLHLDGRDLREQPLTRRRAECGRRRRADLRRSPSSDSPPTARRSARGSRGGCVPPPPRAAPSGARYLIVYA
jgi:hypothetical protein